MPTIPGTLLKEDVASVTPLGILYQNLCYTSAGAIRERWFEIARRSNNWSIPIKYTPTNMNLIYILTEYEEIEECRIVARELFQGIELETYLQSIQLMKLAREIFKNDN